MLFIPSRWRETFKVRIWSLLNVPLLFFVRPSVVTLTPSTCTIRIRLGRRTRNHLGSMYFGALSAGADCAGGLMAMRAIEEAGGGVSLIFKNFRADFLKRAEGDVFFTAIEGEAIRDLVRQTIATGERAEMAVAVTAAVAGETVARFELTLSLKSRR